MPAILGVHPMGEYLMEIRLNNGSTVILNLADKMSTIRFSPLQDRKLFESATTDGRKIRWDDYTEMSVDEIFEIASRDRKKSLD